MGRLLAFLIAYRNVIWFVAIQGVSLVLLASYNTRHQMVFASANNAVTNSVQATGRAISDYFNLAGDNEKLLAENIDLRKQLIRQRQELELYKFRNPDSNFTILPDSLIPDESYEFIPCKAMFSSTSSEYNYIKIDVGDNDGAEIGMGVISEDGIAGKVVQTSENYSLVMSTLNTRFLLPAVIKESNIKGTFKWREGNPRYGYLEYVPLHFEVKKGQAVMSSFQSQAFPPGFLIGHIDYIDKEQPEGFYNIRIKLSTDFYRIHYLYLVKNSRKEELDSLIIRDR